MKKKEEGKKIVDGGEVSRTCAGFKCGGMWQIMNSLGILEEPHHLSAPFTPMPRHQETQDTQILEHAQNSCLLFGCMGTAQFYSISHNFTPGISHWD